MTEGNGEGDGGVHCIESPAVATDSSMLQI